MKQPEMKTAPRNTTWIVKWSVCAACDSNLVICQTTEKFTDYWWYCSNKSCKHHHPGEQIGDQEECSFAKQVPEE